MFNDTIVNLLMQIPLVGAFMWFVLESNKRNNEAIKERDAAMRGFLREQREEDREMLGRLVGEIQKIAELQESHDRRVGDALIIVQERTSKQAAPVRSSKGGRSAATG